MCIVKLPLPQIAAYDVNFGKVDFEKIAGNYKKSKRLRFFTITNPRGREKLYNCIFGKIEKKLRENCKRL